MKASFISFEGTEGCGKSTQIEILSKRLREMGYKVVTLREPGGTPIGEEIRHTLKHSKDNQAMTPEAELLLMNASRAQLVREVIRPALEAGTIVLCDRFYDSTTAYQGYGRGLDLKMVKTIIDLAVGETRPNKTLLFHVPPEVSFERLAARQATMPFLRDRFEEADRGFFDRVAEGYTAIARDEPRRVSVIDASGSVVVVAAAIWAEIAPLLRMGPLESQDVVQDTLGKIRERIHHSESIRLERRQELLELVGRLATEVSQLSRTHHEQAQAIAGLASDSAREATRSAPDTHLLKHSLQSLSSSAKEFEQTHPRLVQIVNAISNSLSNLGI